MDKTLFSKLKKIDTLKEQIISLEETLKFGVKITVLALNGHRVQLKETSPEHLAASAIFENTVRMDIEEKTKELESLLTDDSLGTIA